MAFTRHPPAEVAPTRPASLSIHTPEQARLPLALVLACGLKVGGVRVDLLADGVAWALWPFGFVAPRRAPFPRLFRQVVAPVEPVTARATGSALALLVDLRFATAWPVKRRRPFLAWFADVRPMPIEHGPALADHRPPAEWAGSPRARIGPDHEPGSHVERLIHASTIPTLPLRRPAPHPRARPREGLLESPHTSLPR